MSKLNIVVNDFKILKPHYAKPAKNWDDIETPPKGRRAVRRQNATLAKMKRGQK